MIIGNNDSLASVWLHLQPVERTAGPGAARAGYLAHAAFLNLLRQTDPQLSQRLHDLNGRKPFTLSGLLEEGRWYAAGPLRPDKTYQLRLTSLDGALFESFIGQFLTYAGTVRLRLGDWEFALRRIEGSGASKNDWIGRSSFTTLAEAGPGRDWEFEFASPTAFSEGEMEGGGRKFVVLPDPGWVFDSLGNNWNCFASKQFEQLDLVELRKYVNRYVAISHCAIQTVAMPFKAHQQLGFVGRVRYRLLERQPSPIYAAILNRLAAFALYSGVGYKTTMGLGQVRATSLTNLSRSPEEAPPAQTQVEVVP